MREKTTVEQFRQFKNKLRELIVKTDENYDHDQNNQNYNSEEFENINFILMNEIKTKDDLMNYNQQTIVANARQQTIIRLLGIDNIKKFEHETGFFSHKANNYSIDLEMFEAFVSYFGLASYYRQQIETFLAGRTLSYEEFKDILAICLDDMRSHNVFTDYNNYDWMRGEFREEHPETFIDLEAPDDLREAFYKNKITPEWLCNHKEYIPYLLDKDLEMTIKAKIKLKTERMMADKIVHNFITEYSLRYGNEKLLNLIAKYGKILTEIDILSYEYEIENEELIEKKVREAIYNMIIDKWVDYAYLAQVDDFVEDYPELFIDLNISENMADKEEYQYKKFKYTVETAFYNGKLTFEDIRRYPQLEILLRDKNLYMAFRDQKKIGGISSNASLMPRRIFRHVGNYGLKTINDLELLDLFGNEKFLELCRKYGRYMENINYYLHKELLIVVGKDGKTRYGKVENNVWQEVSFKEITKIIERIIGEECKNGDIPYYPEDAPDFLKKNHPELFLSAEAPEELQKYFYNRDGKYTMSFIILNEHKEWLPYLQGKLVSTSLFRSSLNKDVMQKYFQLFGEEKGLCLGIKRMETVIQMIESHQVDLMKRWYDKTGRKFIPDYVVMQNFSLEDADKFLISGNNWSTLMRIKSYASIPDARDAMLKVAYSFGTFDHDQKGFKKVQDLLTSLPRKIAPEFGYVIKNIDMNIDLSTKYRTFITGLRLLLNDEIYQRLFEALKEENKEIAINAGKIFSQLYRKNEDNSYTLTINPQKSPKTCQIVETILADYAELPILTPLKAHQLFGGFELKYDPDFREFLLANIEDILKEPQYVTYLASIQRQFTEIKVANSNRGLTLDLAMSYVQSNKYTNVNVGNERMAEVAAIAGYSQKDFDTLQQIYNYGKQRTVSSIPRIKNTNGKYTYEMLRLDDPLAMAIGTLTDCCQELGNTAEGSMEHSMVDKNGRVFVVRDFDGNIVAQSWVWRNKDVLCFDNIEIPNKTFTRVLKNNLDSERKIFTDEIYSVYKQAAQDLIVEDETKYKQLLESEKITKDQYEGLRLGKITVGLGYNDIADSIKRNAFLDQGVLTSPVSFIAPVKLQRGLYTSDSNTQYILEDRKAQHEYVGDTLAVHSDTYTEYNDSNFTRKLLLTLEKLELVTVGDEKYLKTKISEQIDEKHLVSILARNYGLNSETTRIIVNPNFAIIYDIRDDRIIIGDLLFNTLVDNGEQQLNIEAAVILQIWLALEQITEDKDVDISLLSVNQKAMYQKVISLTEEFDIERGIGHGR